jgi:hypothetical protein
MTPSVSEETARQPCGRRVGRGLFDRPWLKALLTPLQTGAQSLCECVGETWTVLTWSHHGRPVLKDINDQVARHEKIDPHLSRWLARAVNEDTSAGLAMVDFCKVPRRHYFHPRTKRRWARIIRRGGAMETAVAAVLRTGRDTAAIVMPSMGPLTCSRRLRIGLLQGISRSCQTPACWYWIF